MKKEYEELFDILTAYGQEEVRAKDAMTKKARKAYKIERFAFSFFGFITGLIFAVNEMLVYHGPTVTLLGTIAATLIYVASGFAFAKLFAWLVDDYFSEVIEIDKANQKKKRLVRAMAHDKRTRETIANQFFASGR